MVGSEGPGWGAPGGQGAGVGCAGRAPGLRAAAATVARPPASPCQNRVEYGLCHFFPDFYKI